MNKDIQKLIDDSADKSYSKLTDKQLEQYNYSNFSHNQLKQHKEFATKGGYKQGKINGNNAVTSGQIIEFRKAATKAHKKSNWKHQKSIASLGGLASANSKNHVNKQKSICPHCNKEGNYVAMARWHMDKCKHKNID
jgi:hypothetical protein